MTKTSLQTLLLTLKLSAEHCGKHGSTSRVNLCCIAVTNHSWGFSYKFSRVCFENLARPHAIL